MREEQENLLAADDAGDVPAVTRPGDVSAAFSLHQDDLAPFLFMPDTVDIDCSGIAVRIKPRFALGCEIPRIQARRKNENHADKQYQGKTLLHFRLLIAATYSVSQRPELYHC